MRGKTRIGLGLCFLSAIGGAVLTAVYLDRTDPRLQQIEELKKIVSRLEEERRIAEVMVTDQIMNLETGRMRTTFRFAHLGPDGAVLSASEHTIDGDVAYFDALVVKFEHSFVELGDALKGKSLYLFRRVFGEHQEPNKGFPLDDTVPAPYRIRPAPSDFEKELWRRFWDCALNPSTARELGVRVAQGEAVYTRLRPGKLYRLTIETAGGLNLKAADLPAVLRESR